MCVSVCRIYLLLYSTYVILLLNYQNTLSQKLRPSEWRGSLHGVTDPSVSVRNPNKESRQRRAPPQTGQTRTGQKGFRKNMETSCRHKCGQLFDLPCSCDSQCSVYKNCCEDLYVECPEMLVEAESLYTPELLNSQIECIHNGMLAIAGCPSVSSIGIANLSNTWIREHRERMNRLQAALTEKKSLTDTEEDSQAEAQCEKQRQSILQLLSDIPVSDISTGLLYKTPEIFSCYIGAQSVPMLWGVEIATSTMLAGVKQIQHLKPEKDSVKYIPPAQLPRDNAYRFCVPDAIGTCKHPQDKCDAFLSYVYVPRPPKPPAVYNNKYCALCNGLAEASIINLTKREETRTTFPLSVIMSLSNDQLKLSTVGQGHFKQFTPWTEAECNLGSQIVENGKTSGCRVDSCGETTVLRPDGTCKSLRDFKVALSDHGHTPFPASHVISLTGQDPKTDQEDSSQKKMLDGPLGALPDLIRCILETHFGYELGEATFPLMIRRDHRLKATMFVLNVQMYVAASEGHELMDISTSAMSQIAKALFLYNTIWYLMPTTKLRKTSDAYNETVLEEINTGDGFFEYAFTNRLSFKTQNCSEKLVTFTICVCNFNSIQFFRNSDNTHACGLLCFEDALCKNQVMEVQAFSESKCFSKIRSLACHGTCCTPVNSVLVVVLTVLVIID